MSLADALPACQKANGGMHHLRVSHLKLYSDPCLLSSLTTQTCSMLRRHLEDGYITVKCPIPTGPVLPGDLQ